MTISVARTKFIVNIESFKNQNPDLKDNSSRVYSLAQYFPTLWQYSPSIVVILTSIESILEKCVHLQV